jgi:hypothetical protein
VGIRTPNHEIRYSKIHARLAGGTSRQAEERETGLVRRSKLMYLLCVYDLLGVVVQVSDCGAAHVSDALPGTR